ncbi:hypothetical protein ACA910_004078 [Epithemia clementina (nom. ined.)]
MLTLVLVLLPFLVQGLTSSSFQRHDGFRGATPPATAYLTQTGLSTMATISSQGSYNHRHNRPVSSGSGGGRRGSSFAGRRHYSSRDDQDLQHEMAKICQMVDQLGQKVIQSTSINESIMNGAAVGGTTASSSRPTTKPTTSSSSSDDAKNHNQQQPMSRVKRYYQQVKSTIPRLDRIRQELADLEEALDALERKSPLYSHDHKNKHKTQEQPRIQNDKTTVSRTSKEKAKATALETAETTRSATATASIDHQAKEAVFTNIGKEKSSSASSKEQSPGENPLVWNLTNRILNQTLILEALQKIGGRNHHHPEKPDKDNGTVPKYTRPPWSLHTEEFLPVQKFDDEHLQHQLKEQFQKVQATGHKVWYSARVVNAAGTRAVKAASSSLDKAAAMLNYIWSQENEQSQQYQKSTGKHAPSFSPSRPTRAASKTTTPAPTSPLPLDKAAAMLNMIWAEEQEQDETHNSARYKHKANGTPDLRHQPFAVPMQPPQEATRTLEPTSRITETKTTDTETDPANKKASNSAAHMDMGMVFPVVADEARNKATESPTASLLQETLGVKNDHRTTTTTTTPTDNQVTKELDDNPITAAVKSTSTRVQTATTPHRRRDHHHRCPSSVSPPVLSMDPMSMSILAGFTKKGTTTTTKSDQAAAAITRPTKGVYPQQHQHEQQELLQPRVWQRLPEHYELVTRWTEHASIPPTLTHILFQLRNCKVASWGTDAENTVSSRWGLLETMRAQHQVSAMKSLCSDEISDTEELQPPSVEFIDDESFLNSSATTSLLLETMEARHETLDTLSSLRNDDVRELPRPRQSLSLENKQEYSLNSSASSSPFMSSPLPPPSVSVSSVDDYVMQVPQDRPPQQEDFPQPKMKPAQTSSVSKTIEQLAMEWAEINREKITEGAHSSPITTTAAEIQSSLPPPTATRTTSAESDNSYADPVLESIEELAREWENMNKEEGTNQVTAAGSPNLETDGAYAPPVTLQQSIEQLAREWTEMNKEQSTEEPSFVAASNLASSVPSVLETIDQLERELGQMAQDKRTVAQETSHFQVAYPSDSEIASHARRGNYQTTLEGPAWNDVSDARDRISEFPSFNRSSHSKKSQPTLDQLQQEWATRNKEREELSNYHRHNRHYPLSSTSPSCSLETQKQMKSSSSSSGGLSVDQLAQEWATRNRDSSVPCPQSPLHPLHSLSNSAIASSSRTSTKNRTWQSTEKLALEWASLNKIQEQEN